MAIKQVRRTEGLMINVTPPTRRVIELEAARHRTTMSDVIRQAIDAHLGTDEVIQGGPSYRPRKNQPGAVPEQNGNGR
jgi:hypothetical protein